MLDKLAQVTDARGGVLLAANKKVVNWTASAGACKRVEFLVSCNGLQLSVAGIAIIASSGPD